MGPQRRALTIEDRAEIWRRWAGGEGVCEVAVALSRTHPTIQGVVRANGGVTPRVRRRSAISLSLAEREEISRGVCAGSSLRSIARALGRSAATVCREVRRGGGRFCYRANRAEARAWHRARRPKPCLLVRNPKLARVVARKLQEDWSPEQISRWLEWEYRDDETMRVSHETIYRSLFIQARGALKKQLISHLRSRRKMRKAQSALARGCRRGQIIDAVSIRQRPAEASDRAIPGHWEGDLLCGGKKTQIATLVERRSRFVILVKLPGKDTTRVVNALSAQARKLPAHLRRTLTWDRGLELADHKRFTIATDMQVFFCDPQSPWQRGTNENTNGLLRQYFPKGSVLSGYTQPQLNAVAKRLNSRPRKTLGYHTPAYVLEQGVAPTG
jgi:transposase, IS30 family